MPYTVNKLKGGKVSVTSPHGTRAKSTTPAKAKRQVRLLNALENNPDFRAKLKSAVMKQN